MDTFVLAFTHFKQLVGDNWHIITISSLLLYGTYQYLFDKTITSSKVEHFSPDFSFLPSIAGTSFFVTISSGTVLYYLIEFTPQRERILLRFNEGMWFGLAQGVLFFLINYFKSESRRRNITYNVVQAVTRSNIILVILVSWFFLGESEAISRVNWLSFSLILISIYLFNKPSDQKISEELEAVPKKSELFKISAFIFLLLALVSAAGIQLLSRYAVGPTKINIFLFMFFSNFISFNISIFSIYSFKKKHAIKGDAIFNAELRRIFVKGIFLGVLNIASFSALLTALSIKEAAIVVPIYSLYIVIPIMLNAIIDGEYLKERLTLATVVSLLAILIME